MEAAELKGVGKDRVRIKRKTLEVVLQQCQFALQHLASGCDGDDEDDDSELDDAPQDSADTSSAPANCDTETAEFYDLLKSRVDCADFLKKLENAQASIPENMTEEGSSWDMVGEDDLWEGGNVELDQEEYVLVCQEDIMEGIASFMAAYLLSLKQTKEHIFQGLRDLVTHGCNNWMLWVLPSCLPCAVRYLKAAGFGGKKIRGGYRTDSDFGVMPSRRIKEGWELVKDLTPNQLQEALSKTFSIKKKKGKLMKAWDGSKVIYNVASWGATAIGIYQNPALLRAASAAFWTSCHVISKLF